MISGQSLALGTPANSLNGSAALGEHPDGLLPVAPRSDSCKDIPRHTARPPSWSV